MWGHRTDSLAHLLIIADILKHTPCENATETSLSPAAVQEAPPGQIVQGKLRSVKWIQQAADDLQKQFKKSAACCLLSASYGRPLPFQ